MVLDSHAVIFDLDGTLLDTLEDIAAAANRTMAFFGYPIHSLAAYRRFVGNGSEVLIERAMPTDQRTPERIAECLRIHLDDYSRNWAVATRPYNGIPELLRYVSDHGIPMSVVTNKPEDAALWTLNHFLKEAAFVFISAIKPGIAKKPDPTQAVAAARAMGVPPERCIFLGDSEVDMQTALGAGMVPIGAGWGFRTREELIGAGARHVIQYPMELVNFF